MARIEVAKQENNRVKNEALITLAQFCYYYPQYTLNEARKLPYKYVALLLKTAIIEMNKNYLNLTQIVSAPHFDKGKGVNKLIKQYEREARWQQ